jgi:hypothetical protein
MMPNRDTLLWAAAVCFGLGVVFGLFGIGLRLNLVALGLTLATLAQLRSG